MATEFRIYGNCSWRLPSMAWLAARATAPSTSQQRRQLRFHMHEVHEHHFTCSSSTSIPSHPPTSEGKRLWHIYTMFVRKLSVPQPSEAFASCIPPKIQNPSHIYTHTHTHPIETCVTRGWEEILKRRSIHIDGNEAVRCLKRSREHYSKKKGDVGPTGCDGGVLAIWQEAKQAMETH